MFLKRVIKRCIHVLNAELNASYKLSKWILNK